MCEFDPGLLEVANCYQAKDGWYNSESDFEASRFHLDEASGSYQIIFEEKYFEKNAKKKEEMMISRIYIKNE